VVTLPRVIVITGGLILVGMIAGGFAAGCALALYAILHGDWRGALDLELWGFAGAVGAGIGAVVAPLTSWLFLRHVPLGRLILQTTVGTILAGGVGFALGFSPLIMATLGYLAAAVRLAVVTPRRTELQGSKPGQAGSRRPA